MKSISLGTIYSTYDTLCDGLDDIYHRLKELLVKLAEFYLPKYSTTWFTEPYTFFVSLGNFPLLENTIPHGL